jgi:hypothetical protein
MWADYGILLPSAVACFEDDFEACIAHLRLPVTHRRSTRTTNLLVSAQALPASLRQEQQGDQAKRASEPRAERTERTVQLGRSRRV